MESTEKKGMPISSKIIIGVNISLFGITGVIHLIKGKPIIGYTLLAAGITNVLYLLFSFNIQHLVFVILTFIFAAVSLWVSLESISSKDTTIGIIWTVVTLVYLITGFILLMKLQRSKREE